MEENFKFYQHEKCEFFPCHKSEQVKNFNCLFCYCPLYALKEECDGNFKYTIEGIKDCSNCMIPHSANGYDYIMSKMPHLTELTRKK